MVVYSMQLYLMEHVVEGKVAPVCWALGVGKAAPANSYGETPGKTSD